ncbi:MAG: tRNA (N6-isopentenyl adenosine(37)-C2)-methylthiotransferase MiaB [Lachnospiraceae bacterium]|nr:tRNA (N6-isopentenyl adenosine(37)-C2)-methylthiotransferase MiaB [Lachnospiraceae bacterium]MDD7326509.1 tRNA (N6-isopentenyl adenosine(37)-C2)-methylthiotransferase MiaB [Lachnospiraceae bacterium]MDY2760224.1 tRNA (N6-isopentenyl adenosine(37)-C2)-methylthiotransferase MiaB [Lachnospiraceae bacterium]
MSEFEYKGSLSAAETDIPVTEPERQYYFMGKVKKIVDEKTRDLGRPLTFHVTTFGCQMNARDSEKLRGILLKCGYTEKDDEDADLVLYNTCTVRENADNKVFGRLGVLHGYKKKNKEMLIGLCGCMAQETPVIEKIRKSYPFVDMVFGTHNVYMLAEILYERLTEDKKIVDVRDKAAQIVENLPLERKYSFKSGINIMFGCDNFCSYCIVPYVRGRERSREPEAIIDEIKRLVADGVIEVMLLGQNVNSYGKGLDEKISFADLLRRVNDIDGLKRIRFMTSHPKDLSDDLIDAMAECDKVCNHLHLPLQSGSDRILKDMNRHYTKEKYLTLVDKIRNRIPDIALTTDIIVGYPGETEEDFRETMDVVKRVQYDSAFTFIYSKRSGTPAARRDDQIPEEVIKDRFDRLLAEVRSDGEKKAGALTGQTLPVLVEEVNKQDKSLVTGRLTNNSVVHLPGDESLIGKIVDVRLEECKGFYYLGEAESQKLKV